MTDDLHRAIRWVEAAVGEPPCDLSEDVFLLVSRLTPLVNVDLLIRDDPGRTLLTWRDDEFYGPGWHVPGGIIRFQETAADRIRQTARIELDAAVAFEPAPVAVRELIGSGRKSRGHFISLLYRCKLLTPPNPLRQFVAGEPVRNQWCWHETFPENMIEVHRQYAEFF